MRRVVLGARSCHDVVGELVFGQGLRLPRFDLVARRVDDVAELGTGLEHDAVVHVRHESRVHCRAVLVDDVRIADDVVGPHHVVLAGQARERWGEQEEADAALQVEALNLSEDGEGRVVEHYASLGVIKSLVVAAGIERAHDACGVEPVAPRRPVEHSAVNLRRRVAVVCRLLGLELLDETLVIVENLLSASQAITSIRA